MTSPLDEIPDTYREALSLASLLQTAFGYQSQDMRLVVQHNLEICLGLAPHQLMFPAGPIPEHDLSDDPLTTADNVRRSWDTHLRAFDDSPTSDKTRLVQSSRAIHQWPSMLFNLTSRGIVPPSMTS